MIHTESAGWTDGLAPGGTMLRMWTEHETEGYWLGVRAWEVKLLETASPCSGFCRWNDERFYYKRVYEDADSGQAVCQFFRLTLAQHILYHAFKAHRALESALGRRVPAPLRSGAFERHPHYLHFLQEAQ